ncbi:MAG: hypothetical protein K9M08_12995, partial [Pirellula sp.]|nr:hypothetical protein [Pirellula sp.]
MPNPVGLRIDVPCPKCKNVLQCDANLDGTRGCCPSCAHVFTISMDHDLSATDNALESFPFACPKCKKLFEGTPDKEGKKAKCTDCSEVFVIERYTPPKSPKSAEVPKRDESQKVPSAIGTKKNSVDSKTNRSGPPVLNTPATSSQPVATAGSIMDLTSMLPPPASSMSAPSYMPPSVSPTPTIRRKKRTANSNQGSRLGLILGIVGGIGGLVLLLCCGGVGVLFWMFTQKQTILSSGYSADAIGIVAKKNKLHANLSGQLIVNPMTRSEFIIATGAVDGNRTITPESYIQALNSSGQVRAQSVSPVSRAGLNGLRYQVLGTDAPHTAEVFGLGDTILLVMYANGTNLQERQGTKPRMTAERAKEWDKPD